MTEEITKDVKDMTKEEIAAAWANWVRSEVNSALNIYLDKAISGNINIKYYPHVQEVLETGPVFNEGKADGVLISVEFLFEEPLDLTKPRLDE